MSAWRRKAIEFLPRFRNEIQDADSVTYLWVEISSEFNEAVRVGDNNFVEGALRYLIWSAGPESGDEAKQAIFCGFLEDIACVKNNWQYFNIWFTKQQYEQYKGSFACALSAKEFESLNNVFYKK